MKENKPYIHSRLNVLLAEKKMTKTQLAIKANISPSTVTRLAKFYADETTGKKAPKISADSLLAVCKVLDCQPGDILEYVKGGGETE